MKFKTVAMLVCLMLTFPLVAAFQGGTEADPLVTKSWVDKYINDEFAKLETEVNELSERLHKNVDVVLYIGKNTAVVNDEEKNIDVPPMLVDGRTMIPLRFLGESLGATFSWDGKAKKVEYVLDNNKISLWIGKKEVNVNGKTKSIDVGPILENGRTLVPLRLVSEEMGLKVNWEAKEKKVTIKD